MTTIYTVTYSGPFGYIKPWTAVRDILTYSQPFLTPSIVEGMRQKLGVEAILRHRLRHGGIDVQQERTQSAGWTVTSKSATRSPSIIQRGVMLAPALTLAFRTQADAEIAATQHLCLCRNEDVVLPTDEVCEVEESDFDLLPGIELLFGKFPDSLPVGYNRFEETAPMYGRLVIVDEQ